MTVLDYFLLYRKSCIKPPGAYLFQTHVGEGEGGRGLIKRKGLLERGRFIQISKGGAISSQLQEAEAMQLRIENKSDPNFQLVNKTSWISPHKVFQLTVVIDYYSLS